jgi:hypothetical protein
VEFRGVVYKLSGVGALVRGDDGGRCFLPRSEALGRAPRIGDRYLFDVMPTNRTPLAVGARRLEGPAAIGPQRTTPRPAPDLRDAPA